MLYTVRRTPNNVQEKAVRQECTDEHAAPSEKVVQMQRSSAVNVWGALQDDEDLLSLSELPSLPSTACSGGSVKSRNSKNGKTPTTTTSTSKSTKAKNPVAEAASQRAKTMKEWKSCEANLQKAIQHAETVLNTDAVDVHGSDEKAQGDPSLQLIRDRLNLAKLAVDRTSPVTAAQNQLLYSECLKDPFLRDLSDSLLASQDGVQCVAWIDHVRSRVLDLQPSAEKIHQLMDCQRNALVVLQKIAGALVKETDTWKSNIFALKKAKLEEEKAAQKAEQALAKKEERKAKRAQAAKARAEEKKRKADAVAAAEKSGDEQGDDPDDKGKRRRRAAKASQLADDDPSVLRTIRNATWLPPTTICSTVEEFVEHVATQPNVPVIARLRKANIKKVLSVTCSNLICCEIVT